ncbi:hypothetical protein M569_04009, partial [Genlisea aurea]
RCRSWRVAGEANNLASWKTIPEACGEYVKDYMSGEGYELDLETVSREAEWFARSLDLGGDRKLAWIFDVDETLLSNLPYYQQHGYGLEVFDEAEFDKWVEMGVAPAIEHSLKLYEVVDALGFRILLLTGRSERHRDITVNNLFQAGFRPSWDKLIMRGSEDHGKSATRYKSEKRRDLMEGDGYELAGNSGDQWSDLLDSYMSLRSFKLPNPMYYI